MSEETKQPLGWAPTDPTDGHQRGEWRSKYDDQAKSEIRFEAWYLAILLFGAPLAMLVLWLRFPMTWLGLDEVRYEPLMRYCLAWLGGLMGGTLFDVKWLYHSVARQIWHLDRRLWRLFTPHLSATLAFIVITLISSGVLRVFDRDAIKEPALVVGVSFLVGYFSDCAVAKLIEIARLLFGAGAPKGDVEGQKEPPRNT